jgi:hypothetical protein
MVMIANGLKKPLMMTLFVGRRAARIAAQFRMIIDEKHASE